MARVAIIDDSIDTVQMLSLALSYIGHEPIPAHWGAEAIQLVSDQRPDVVLLDLMMPEMDGCHMLRRLRALPEGSDLPIIVVTASAGPSVEERVASAGGSACLFKPLSLDVLAGTIADCVGAATREPS